MEPSTSAADSQTELLSLLRKLSQDNDQLRNEMVSLRKETRSIKRNLQTRLDNAVESIPTKIEQNILCLKRSMKIYIHNNVTKGITSTADTLQRVIFKQIDELEESISSNVAGSVTEATREVARMRAELRRALAILSSDMSEMEANIKEATYEQFSDKCKAIRSDLSNVQRTLEAAQTSHENCDDQAGFTLFNKLPPELRLKIWELACFDNPSVVKIHVEYGESSDEFVCSGYRLPAVLQVNRESRQESLKWYKKTTVDIVEDHIGDPSIAVNPKYFNFSADILYLDMDLSSLDRPESAPTWIDRINQYQELCRSRFRRVAVSFDEFRKPLDGSVNLLLKPQCTIDEVIIVTNGDELSESRQRLVPVRGMFECPLGYKDSELTFSDHVGHRLRTDWAEGLVQSTINLLDSTLKSREARARDEDSPEDPAPLAWTGSGKPWPKFTLMTLKDVNHVRNTGIALD